jgi:hypothetical protein
LLKVCRGAGRASCRSAVQLFSFLVLVWTEGPALGNALILYPVLGTAIQSSGGKTPTDFVSALYAGGSSISIVGSSDISPRTSRFRLLYLFNSIAGLSVISLTLTYLMQIHSLLQQRNAFAPKVYCRPGAPGCGGVGRRIMPMGLESRHVVPLGDSC